MKGTFWQVWAAIALGIILSLLPKALGYFANTSLELAVFWGFFGVMMLFFCAELYGFVQRRRDLKEIARETIKTSTQQGSSFNSTCYEQSMTPMFASRVGSVMHERISDRIGETSTDTTAKDLEISLERLETEIERLRSRVVMSKCRHCGVIVPDGFDVCPKCGAKVSARLK